MIRMEVEVLVKVVMGVRMVMTVVVEEVVRRRGGGWQTMAKMSCIDR